MKEINYFNTKTKAATKYSEGFCHGLILLLQTEYKKRLGYCDLFNQLSPFLR